jgi:hypothetical protein
LTAQDVFKELILFLTDRYGKEKNLASRDVLTAIITLAIAYSDAMGLSRGQFILLLRSTIRFLEKEMDKGPKGMN